ncbi:UNVERIFIED_CONTAM: hypothetical protein FKN15_039536 [Acipenser sinensis]
MCVVPRLPIGSRWASGFLVGWCGGGLSQCDVLQLSGEDFDADDVEVYDVVQVVFGCDFMVLDKVDISEGQAGAGHVGIDPLDDSGLRKNIPGRASWVTMGACREEQSFIIQLQAICQIFSPPGSSDVGLTALPVVKQITLLHLCHNDDLSGLRQTRKGTQNRDGDGDEPSTMAALGVY